MVVEVESQPPLRMPWQNSCATSLVAVGVNKHFIFIDFHYFRY